MKQNRFFAMIMAATMVLSLVGCGTSAASAASNAAPEPSAQVTAEPTAEPTIEPTVEPTAEPTVEPTVQPTAEPTVEPTAEPTAEPTPEPSAESTAQPATDAKPLPQVDYSSDVTDWMYEPENPDELTDLLVSIDTVPHGAAGASLQQANAAVCLMKLATEDSDKSLDAAKTYLDAMTDTQRDYFSFQWQQAVKLANGFLDGSEDAAILEDSGNHDFDLSAVDSTKVTQLDQSVTDLLRSAGVTDEWKNQTDNEIFQVGD